MKVVKKSFSVLLSLVVMFSILSCSVFTTNAKGWSWFPKKETSNVITDPFDKNGDGKTDTNPFTNGEITDTIGTTETEPFILYTVNDLNILANIVNGENGYKTNFTCEGYYFKLSGDFDNSTVFKRRIGKNSTCCFNGTFDGNKATINLNIEGTGNNWGLFGYIGKPGTVKNINVTGYVKSTSAEESCYYGGICGYNKGTIINCINDSEICGTKNKCSDYGGICGCNEGIILNCINNATIFSEGIYCCYYGGICGDSYNTIANCTNMGAILSKNNTCRDYGGICGFNGYNSIVINCVNSGNVSSEGSECENYGGVCGSNDGTITNCISSGIISKENNDCINYGEICGYNEYGKLLNCYCDSSICTKKPVGAGKGYTKNVEGIETCKLASGEEGALIDKLNDYVDATPTITVNGCEIPLKCWDIENGSYPFLKVEDNFKMLRSALTLNTTIKQNNITEQSLKMPKTINNKTGRLIQIITGIMDRVKTLIAFRKSNIAFRAYRIK